VTYVLTTLNCYPRRFPLNIFAKKLREEGLLEEQLMQWSIQQFLDQRVPDIVKDVISL